MYTYITQTLEETSEGVLGSSARHGLTGCKIVSSDFSFWSAHMLLQSCPAHKAFCFPKTEIWTKPSSQKKSHNRKKRRSVLKFHEQVLKRWTLKHGQTLIKRFAGGVPERLEACRRIPFCITISSTRLFIERWLTVPGEIMSSSINSLAKNE